MDKKKYFNICYTCFGQEAEYLFEWVILNDHLQSSQGSKQLDHIFFVLCVASILWLWLRALGSPTSHMGQSKLDFK